MRRAARRPCSSPPAGCACVFPDCPTAMIRTYALAFRSGAASDLRIEIGRYRRSHIGSDGLCVAESRRGDETKVTTGYADLYLDSQSKAVKNARRSGTQVTKKTFVCNPAGVQTA